MNAGPSGRKEHLKEQDVETGCSKHNRDIKRNETSFWTSRKGERRQKMLSRWQALNQGGGLEVKGNAFHYINTINGILMFSYLH